MPSDAQPDLSSSTLTPLPSDSTSSPSSGLRRLAWARPVKIVCGLVVVFLGVFLLYALSFGPAMAKNQRGELPIEFIETFYMPLSIVSDMTGTQGLLERYVALWVSPDLNR